MTKLFKIVVCLIGVIWFIDTLNDVEPSSPQVEQHRGQTGSNRDQDTGSFSSLKPMKIQRRQTTDDEENEVERVLSIKDIYVTGSVVNVRATPEVSGAKLGSFERGAQLRFTGETSGPWHRILLGNGGSGWMHGDYLSLTSLPIEEPAPVRQTISYSKSDVAKAIIKNSIQSYAGSCPCPYNRDRAGRRCGGRSAWSRPGGASPICYQGDVTQARIESWIARQRGATLVR